MDNTLTHPSTKSPARFRVACCLLWLGASMTLAPGVLRAQTPAFEVMISPPDGTVMLVGSTNLISVSIPNLALFTNVTVTGTFGPLANLVFLDDGTPPDQTASDGTYSYQLIPNPALVGTQMLTVLVHGEDGSIVPDPDPTNIVEVFATNTLSYFVVEPPPNDAFTNATKLARSGGWFSGQNRYSTFEAEEPFHSQIPEVGRSVWWTWSPTVSTNVLIDTAGTTFNAVLGVYRGTSLGLLQEVASAMREGSSGLQPWVRFRAEAGATYRIVVAGANEMEMGDIRGRIVLDGQPDRSAPQVVIDLPADGALFAEENVLLVGQARDDARDDTGVSEVIVSQDGTEVARVTELSWTVGLTLRAGTNQVSVVAVDIAGNRSVPATVFLIYRSPFNDDFSEAIELFGLARCV